MSNYKDFLVATGSSGSGGSAAIKPTTLYSENKIGTWSPSEPQAWDEITSYARVHQYSPRGQFAIHSHTFSSSAQSPNYNSNRLRIAPFTVHQTTGVMTFGTSANAFINTSGFVHSTMSYGFHGSYGVNWGHSAWGSGNTHYYGGCVWRIVNNAVVGGQSTGNSTYATENTSNGMLPVYEYGGTTFYNIPNGNYTSMGSITSSGYNADWASQNESGGSNGYTYLYRCVGKTVGEGHAGLQSNAQHIIAMNAQGSNGTVGSSYAAGSNQAQSGGIGFELESGKQVYFTTKGTFIRGSEVSGIQGLAVVTVAGAAASSIPLIGGGAGSALKDVGVTNHSATYNASGYPAKEADTFYYYAGENPNRLIKFKITNPSGLNITIELKGTVDLSEIGGTSQMSHYHALVDVTGNDDQFIVCSYRSGSHQPSHTIVVDNPIKDA